MLSPRKVIILGCLAIFACANLSISHAHFVWLAKDDEGHALLFFNESHLERDYHTPECVVEAKVLSYIDKAKPTELEMEAVAEDDFDGMRSKEKVVSDFALETTCTYGIYHGSLLKYYVKHVALQETTKKPVVPGGNLKLTAVPIHTKVGIDVLVYWDGKPLEDVGVTIIDAEGEQAGESTDKNGIASFATQAKGLTGFVIAHTVEAAPGEFKGKEYESESHYCTLTCNYTPKTMPSDKQEPAKVTSNFPKMPEALASFGAAESDGWLYTYSGHIGTAHAHSRDNLSQHFRRVKIENDSNWEELPMQTPLQGLALVSYKGKIYRIGGLDARNAKGDDADLHSVNDFACFNPDSNSWTALPSLPEARSSHDAVVIGDYLYVVGGWTLSGEGSGDWIESVYRFDLTDPAKSWEAITKTPFLRRALATSHWQGKLVVLCGMDQDNEISQSVNCYNPESGEWSELAEFPGSGMDGFGISAWNKNNQLYASGSEGILYRLAEDGKSWISSAEINTPRFFHRIMPGADNTMLVIAGASLDRGHMKSIEILDLSASN